MFGNAMQRPVAAAYTIANAAAVDSSVGWVPEIPQAIIELTPEGNFNSLSIDNKGNYDCYLYWNQSSTDYEYISANDYFVLEPDDRRSFRNVKIKAVSTSMGIGDLTVTYRYVPRRG